MSWIDNLKDTTFEIQTGDGQLYYPSLFPAFEENTEYNASEYEYINREGSLVVRRFPKGNRYPLKFAFQGENHIIEAENFKFSAKDNRSWKIKHPIFGNKTVQPLSLNSDSSGLSSTIFTTTVVETNLAAPQKPQPAPKEKLEQQFIELEDSVANNLSGEPTANLADQASNVSKASQAYAKAASTVKAIISATRKCLNSINNAISTTSAAIRYIQRIISLPAQELSNLKSRVKNLVDTYNKLEATINGKTNLTKAEKVNFEILGTTYISNMVMASTVTNTVDGVEEPMLRSEIIDLQDDINASYSSYVAQIMSQEDDDYRPNPEVLSKLSDIVNNGLFYFSQLLNEALQEREFICTKDTNIIVLAHNLLGLASDENIEQLKKLNSIGISEIMNIKQGRKIAYFV